MMSAEEREPYHLRRYFQLQQFENVAGAVLRLLNRSEIDSRYFRRFVRSANNSFYSLLHKAGEISDTDVSEVSRYLRGLKRRQLEKSQAYEDARRCLLALHYVIEEELDKIEVEHKNLQSFEYVL